MKRMFFALLGVILSALLIECFAAFLSAQTAGGWVLSMIAGAALFCGCWLVFMKALGGME